MEGGCFFAVRQLDTDQFQAVQFKPEPDGDTGGGAYADGHISRIAEDKIQEELRRGDLIAICKKR
jgi:hypothetical protein